MFNEKLANAEQKILSLEKKSIDESEDLKIQMEERSNNYLWDIQILEDENDKYKNQILDLDRDLSDVSSNYERDKALWKERCEFLMNQKKMAKDDLKEA